MMGSDEHTCTYCDGNMLGLMIYCERCLTWYHYNCVNKRRANPELKLKYFSSGNYRRPLDVEWNKDKNEEEEIEEEEEDEEEEGDDDEEDEDNENNREAREHMISQADLERTAFGMSKVSPKSPSETSSNSSQLSSDSSSSTISSNSKFDEAIENKHPSKTSCQHDSSSCTIESSHTKLDDHNPHHRQHHRKQQQHEQRQQNSQGQFQNLSHGTNDKTIASTNENCRKRASKGNRAKLRSKLDAIRRQKRY